MKYHNYRPGRMVPHILQKQRPSRPSRPLGWPTIALALAQLLVTAEQRWNFNAAIHEGLSGPSRFAFDILTSRPDIEREVKGGE